MPGQFAFLAKSPMIDKYDLRSLRQLGSGGGPLSQEICEAVMRRMPHVTHITQGGGIVTSRSCFTPTTCLGYGMTEMTTGMHASALGEGLKALGSVGKIYPNCEHKVN